MILTLNVKLGRQNALQGAQVVGRHRGASVHDVRVGKDPTPAWEKRRPYTDADVEALLENAEDAEKVMVLLPTRPTHREMATCAGLT